MNKAKRSNKVFFSASEVGAATRCTHFYELGKNRIYSDHTLYAIKKGNNVHETITRNAIAKPDNWLVRILRAIWRLLRCK